MDEPNNFDDLGNAQLPEESNNNRTFIIAVGILGGIILISIACLVGVYFFSLNNKSATAQQALANTNMTATAAAFINQALTATSEGFLSLPTTTSTPVPTSVVKVATPTITVFSTPQASQQAAGLNSTAVANTATIGAAYTQAAIAQLTVVVTTTALPKTGIAEDLGLPGFVVMALAFVIVILLARRLRTAPSMNR